GDGVCADRAARPAAVLDHRGLSHGLGHALRDEARDDVGGAARRERNDDADRPRRIALRERRLRREAREDQEDQAGRHGTILGYSTRAPEALTTRAILSKSARRSASKASGVSACGSIPCLASRSRITGSRSSDATARLRWSTVDLGMPAGPS